MEIVCDRIACEPITWTSVSVTMSEGKAFRFWSDAARTCSERGSISMIADAWNFGASDSASATLAPVPRMTMATMSQSR